MALIMLRNVPSIPTLMRAFNHKWMLYFVKCFFCIYWDDHMFFDFAFANVVLWRWLICICWTILVNLGWTLPGHGVWYFWYVVGFSWLRFCWGFLRLYSSKILADSFLFWWYLCMVLELGWWWHHRMSLGVFLLLQPFEKVYGGWAPDPLCTFGRIHMWSHLVLGFHL